MSNDMNQGHVVVMQDIKDLTNAFITQINNDCLLKYNQNQNGNAINNNNNNTESSCKKETKLRYNYKNIKANSKSIDSKAKTQLYFHRQQLNHINLISQWNNNNKQSYSKLHINNNKINERRTMQTDSRLASKNNFFPRTVQSSTGSNKRQFSPTTSTSFYQNQGQNCNNSNPSLRPASHLVSYYCQKKKKAIFNIPFYKTERDSKYYSDINKEYFPTYTQTNFFKKQHNAHNPTTDFKHMRFKNKFFNIKINNKSTKTRKLKKRNYECSQRGNDNGNYSNNNESNCIFALTMPNKMYHQDDSNYNKFIYLSTNNSTKLKQKLILNFFRQRENRYNVIQR